MTQVQTYNTKARTIRFSSVARLEKIGEEGSQLGVTIRLIDANDQRLFDFWFKGTRDYDVRSDPRGVGRATPENVQKLISSLLALCPNVK